MGNNIFFLPFIGRYYANGGLFDRRVMVLGESHYCDGGCCDCGNCRLYKQCANFTQDVLCDFLDETKVRQKWMRTFVKFERSLVGKMTDWALRRKIWDSVMFYNYLQVAMTGPRKAGTSAQYKQAANAFFEVIDKYEPECIIVWGKRLWNNMPNERWQDGDDIVVDGNHIATGYYLLSNGKRAKVVAVYHPSGGYSWDYWHKVIQGLLASI